MNNFKVLMNGIIKENPTFVLLLGMCPTLGTTSSAINGMGMGLATMFVLICSNVVISAIKNLIPDMVRIPSYIVVIASFVTLLQMVMQAYVPALYATLGLFIPLIVVNCIVLGRAEAFAAKNNPVASLFDGIGIGLGFTIALTLLGAVREFLGTGKIFGLSLIPEDYGMLIFVLAPGAFIALGYLIALVNRLKKYLNIYFGSLCKQHRTVTVLGYLSVFGRFQESGYCAGHVGSSSLRTHHCHDCHLPVAEVCIGCPEFGLSADHYIHPCHRRIGTDGGNHSEKSIAFALSGFGRIPPSDYNQLLYFRCGYFGYPEGL